MKTNLTVHWSSAEISLVIHSDNAIDLVAAATEADLTHILAKKFRINAKPLRALLVIPRSEVLQRRLELSNGESQGRDLEDRIAAVLPYAPRDMAYSVVVDPLPGAMDPGTRGLLYAIPDLKIRDIILRLERCGVAIDEVISEDQAIFWLMEHKVSQTTTMILDVTDSRILAVLLVRGAIHSSNVYPRVEFSTNEALQQISLSLLESMIRIERVYVTGAMDVGSTSKYFEVPAESIETVKYNNESLPAVLAGAALRKGRPAISLLPSEQKIRNRHKSETSRMRTGLIALIMCIGSLASLFSAHWMFLHQRKASLEREILRIKDDVADVRRMIDSLESIKSAANSKKRLLVLLKSLAGIPSAGVLAHEIQCDGKNVLLEGESSSHAVLTTFVQGMESVNVISDVKLERARLRRKMNTDFIEFEASAKWG